MPLPIYRGEYHTSHGTTLSALMPSCFEYIKVAKAPKFAAMAEAMGENICGVSDREAADKAIEAIRALLKSLDLPVLERPGAFRKSPG